MHLNSFLVAIYLQLFALIGQPARAKHANQELDDWFDSGLPHPKDWQPLIHIKNNHRVKRSDNETEPGLVDALSGNCGSYPSYEWCSSDPSFSMGGQFPWYAEVKIRYTNRNVRGDNYNITTCFGVLVHCDLVLIPKHCFDTRIHDAAFVQLGIEDEGFKETRYHMVKGICKMPGFKGQQYDPNVPKYDNDLSALLLRSSVRYSSKVQPACIEDRDDVVREDVKCFTFTEVRNIREYPKRIALALDRGSCFPDDRQLETASTTCLRPSKPEKCRYNQGTGVICNENCNRKPSKPRMVGLISSYRCEAGEWSLMADFAKIGYERIVNLLNSCTMDGRPEIYIEPVE